MSNAPYADQRVNGGDISDISNSPFTDERRQGGGEQTPSEGTGNVQYNIDGTLNTRLGMLDTIIDDIDQGASPFAIGNNIGDLSFEASGNIKLIHRGIIDGDIIIEAEEVDELGTGNVRITTNTTGVRGSGNLLATIAGSINMTSETTIGLVTNGSGGIVNICQVGGITNNCVTKYETMCDNFSIETSTNNSWWHCTSSPTDINYPSAGLEMTRTSTGSPFLVAESFDRFLFAGNVPPTTNPIQPEFRFRLPSTSDPSPGSAVQFINNPALNGDVLTWNGFGDGAEGTPYQLNWEPLATGSSGVEYDPISFGLSYGSPSTDIVKIALSDSADIEAVNTELRLNSVGLGNNHIVRLTARNDGTSQADESTLKIQSFLSTGDSIVGECNFKGPFTDSIINDIWFSMRLNNVNLNSASELSLSRSSTQRSELQGRNMDRYKFAQRASGQTNLPTPLMSFSWGRPGANQGPNSANNICYEFPTTMPPSLANTDLILTTQYSTANDSGHETSPYLLEWKSSQTLGSLDTLDITYDTTTSVLVLSDPVDGVISTTSITPGRTILIDDVDIQLTTEVSVLGLSNSIFPPPPSTKLVGNNPPSVGLISGNTAWFPGASFRAIISGDVTQLTNSDILTCKVWSNRGQTFSTVLNQFDLRLVEVVVGTDLGWKWTINFTCRSISDGLTPGVIATNSSFEYNDDAFVPNSEGVIVSNVNSFFLTDIDQYLDFTMNFNVAGVNALKTNLCTIERIY